MALDPSNHNEIDLSQYSREYAGFMRGKARFVLGNLNRLDGLGKPLDNRFTDVLDGGCSIIRVVIALDAERVERMECNGF